MAGEPIPASDTDTNDTNVGRFYTETTGGDFRAITEDRVAHSAGKTASNKGEMPYVDANGKIDFLPPGGDDDIIGFNDGVPVIVPGYSASIELTADITATGSVTLGNFVALRSDGTVEAVAGSETLVSIGADNTSVTSSTSIRYLDGVYNATSGKVAVLYYDAAASNTLHVVIGTVSGTTISFGTAQTFTGGTGATRWDNGRIVWNAAGDKVVVLFEGASGYPYVVCASVSGTVLTFGAAASGITFAFSNNTITSFVHDDVHGSRVVFCLLELGIIVAATYLGTVVNVGTEALFPISTGTGFIPIYDAANARFVGLAANGTTFYALCATLNSGTTWTVGSEASNSTICRFEPVLDTSSGKVGILGINGSSAGQPYAAVLTFSGTTTTINTPVKVANYALTSEGFTQISGSNPPCAYEATSGKLIFTGRVNDSSNDNGLFVYVGTISGTSMTLAEPVAIVGTNATRVSVFAKGTNSDLAIVYQDTDDFDRYHIAHAQIVSGALVIKDDFLMRSVPPTSPAASIGSDARIVLMKQAGWSLIDFNTWGVSGASTGLTIFRIILPTETTNADDWIGVARATVTNGQSCSVRLRGGIADDQTGLTELAEYYLKGDGSLITTDNGRYVGRAISETSLLTGGL